MISLWFELHITTENDTSITTSHDVSYYFSMIPWMSYPIALVNFNNTKKHKKIILHILNFITYVKTIAKGDLIIQQLFGTKSRVQVMKISFLFSKKASRRITLSLRVRFTWTRAYSFWAIIFFVNFEYVFVMLSQQAKKRLLL